jgi:hypothetical protein
MGTRPEWLMTTVLGEGSGGRNQASEVRSSTIQFRISSQITGRGYDLLPVAEVSKCPRGERALAGRSDRH